MCSAYSALEQYQSQRQWQRERAQMRLRMSMNRVVTAVMRFASNGPSQYLPVTHTKIIQDADMLDVDFEWFDPQEIDFHGLKTLLRQLFDVDHELFDLSALSNLILSQPLLGSTVKVPDDEVATNQTDAFAFLTVLNLRTHRVRVCLI